MLTNEYIDRKYFVDESGRWDGVTITDTPVTTGPESPADPPAGGLRRFCFHQNGWYIARFAAEVRDKENQNYSWLFSDACSRGQKAVLIIDTDKYEITRVGYQVWHLGWDKMYFYLPYRHTDNADSFYLSGYGDHPDLRWDWRKFRKSGCGLFTGSGSRKKAGGTSAGRKCMNNDIKQECFPSLPVSAL